MLSKTVDTVHMWLLRICNVTNLNWDGPVTQSCLTLCNPMNCNIPGSSVHGILQARVLEWGAIAFPRNNASSVFLENGILLTKIYQPAYTIMPLSLYIGQHSRSRLSNMLINIMQGTNVNYISNFKFSRRHIKMWKTDNINMSYLIQYI